jgi:hypothetical protein
MFELINMVPLVAVEDFDYSSELAAVARVNAIWSFSQAAGTVP